MPFKELKKVLAKVTMLFHHVQGAVILLTTDVSDQKSAELCISYIKSSTVKTSF